MENFEIKDTKQLISFLYLKDELIHVYDELRFTKDVDAQVFYKVKDRLKLLDEAIDMYIKKSDDCFPIVCLESKVIEPQEKSLLRTNVMRFHLDTTKIIFDGSIPSAGYLQLSYEEQEWGTDVSVKNNMPREALDNWDICGYHYNNPMTTRYIAPGVYMIEKGTVIGVAHSKDKGFVKIMKN